MDGHSGVQDPNFLLGIERIGDAAIMDDRTDAAHALPE
jgi:hypothetical protein